jgi:hypothetical protein
MKTIEEYEVNAKDDNSFNGHVTLYSKNFKNIDESDLTSVIFHDDFDQLKKRQNAKITSLNRKKLVPIISLLLIGTITIGSLTGCQVSKKQEIAKSSYPIESQQPEDPTKNLTVTIDTYHNLWNIAALCYDNASDQQKMVVEIAKDNDIKDPNKVDIDKVVTINVPYSHLHNFGFNVNLVEPTKWEQEEHFITEAWSNFDIPDNDLVSKRNRQDVFEGTDNNPGYLISIASLKDDLDALEQEKNFYGNQNLSNVNSSIDDKKSQIDALYKEAITLTENTTGKKYGNDYQMAATYVIVNNSSSIVKTLNN